MNREQFVEELIAEIRKQNFENSNNNALIYNSVKFSDKEIFTKLCYDYPLVEVEDICRFAINFSQLLTTDLENLHYFVLDRKFLYNIEYLSNAHSKEVDGRYYQAVTLIASVVSLKCPELILCSNYEELNRILINETDEANIYDWSNLVSEFHSFILKSNAALFSGLNCKSLIEGSHLLSLYNSIVFLSPLALFYQENQDFIEYLMNNNSRNNKLYFNAIIEKKNINFQSFLHELLIYFQKECEYYKTLTSELSIIEQKDIKNNNENKNNKNFKDFEILKMIKDTWLHLVFLYRDVFIDFPSQILTYLTLISDYFLNFTSSSSATTTPSTQFYYSIGNQNQYPNTLECLYVIFIANIASFYCKTNNQKIILKNNSDTGENITNKKLEFNNINNNNNNNNYSSNYDYKSARIALKVLLNSKNNLQKFVEFCTKMMPRNKTLTTNKKNNTKNIEDNNLKLDVESIELLCDVVELYFFDVNNVNSLTKKNIEKQQECLIASGLLTKLINFFLDSILYCISIVQKTESDMTNNNNDINDEKNNVDFNKIKNEKSYFLIKNLNHRYYFYFFLFFFFIFFFYFFFVIS
jgi:hypothetical protein